MPSCAALTQLLLQHHADPNIAGEYDKTPLMVAAGLSCGYNIVELLIAAGADVNLKDTYGRTALFAVAASNAGSAEVTRALIQAGANVDAIVNVLGEISVLQQAAISGHHEMIKLLIEAGVDLNWSDADDFEEGYKSGQTPLYKAISFDQEEIAHILMDAGADLKCVTPKGETLLHLAVRHGHADIAERLLQAGLDIDARDIEGATPLKVASIYAGKEILSLLIKHGADLNIAGGSHNWTPLHNACWLARSETVELLLRAGARQDIPDHDGKTALQLVQDEAESKLGYKDYSSILSLLNKYDRG